MKPKEIDKLIQDMPWDERKVWIMDIINNKLDDGENKEIVRYVLDNYGDFYTSRALYLYKGDKSLSDIVCNNECFLVMDDDDKLKFILKEEDPGYWNEDFDRFISNLGEMFEEKKDNGEIKEFILKQFKLWKFIYDEANI